MSQQDEIGNDDVPARSRDVRASKRGIILGIVAFGVLSIVGPCAGIILLTWQQKPAPRTQPPAAVTPAPKTYPREEFRQLVIGKTPDEVIAAVGKPDATDLTVGISIWTYYNRTVDPITGKVDQFVLLNFKVGVVAGVNY